VTPGSLLAANFCHNSAKRARARGHHAHIANRDRVRVQSVVGDAEFEMRGGAQAQQCRGKESVRLRDQASVRWVGCKSQAPSVVHLSAIRARRGKWWYHLEHMGPSRFERMRNGSSRSKYSFETANESRPICLCVCCVGTLRCVIDIGSWWTPKVPQCICARGMRELARGD